MGIVSLTVVKVLYRNNNKVQQQRNKTLKEALVFASDAHRIVAALTDNDSVGKGLVVDLNAECPVSAIQSVLLNKVQVVYTGNLHAERNKNLMVYTKTFQHCHKIPPSKLSLSGHNLGKHSYFCSSKQNNLIIATVVTVSWTLLRDKVRGEVPV